MRGASDETRAAVALVVETQGAALVKSLFAAGIAGDMRAAGLCLRLLVPELASEERWSVGGVLGERIEAGDMSEDDVGYLGEIAAQIARERSKDHGEA